MAEALQEAQLAAQQQEVPVGAVLVCNGQLVARAHNQTEQTGNPTAHAEMLCIQQAAGILNGWRLLESTLYVTLEPCPMCAGALLQSRVGTVVYGARNTLLGWFCTWAQMQRRNLWSQAHEWDVLTEGADGSWISMLPQQSHDRDAITRPSKPHPFHNKMQVEDWCPPPDQSCHA